MQLLGRLHCNKSRYLVYKNKISSCWCPSLEHDKKHNFTSCARNAYRLKLRWLKPQIGLPPRQCFRALQSEVVKLARHKLVKYPSKFMFRSTNLTRFKQIRPLYVKFVIQFRRYALQIACRFTVTTKLMDWLMRNIRMVKASVHHQPSTFGYLNDD